MIARFGAYELDLHVRELRKSGVRVHVPPQSLEILAGLIERPGEVVTRDEIRERLWPHGTIVEFEHSVNAAMKRLRDALCDSADTPRFIETLPRYGYRFLVPVEKHEPAAVRGHFRILGEAGRGAMGVVYRAEDIQLGRTVALKVLPDELSEHPPALEQLRREARIAASLNHPGICTLYGIDQHDGHFCLVMEYLEGQPLSRMLEGGPLGLDHALRVGIQVAEALEAAHSQGIIHGDIKPSNLFLTSSGQVKLMDFGIATRTGDGAFAMRGTPGYMSPEQAEGKPVDRRSDVFALGCVLFEMITGRRAAPPPDSLAVDGLGPEVQPIVIRCLQRDPNARFQTMSELKRALQELKEKPGSRTLKASLAPPPGAMCRSRRGKRC
jgi:serine/threonine protein kinase